MKLIIYKEPKSQSRPRFARHGMYVRTYEQPEMKRYKQYIREIYHAKYGEQRLSDDSALSVNATFYRSIQKSLSNKEKSRRLNNEMLPIVKPDIDNYVKALLDALNGVAFKDDNLIVELTAKKFYSNNPRTEIEIKEI